MEERLLGSEEKDINDLKGRILVENKKIWKVGFPAMLARVTQFGMFVVTQAFIGHVGKLQLAGYALIQIITIRFANGILLGMSSATETLCGQAFGARQYHMMGVAVGAGRQSMVACINISSYYIVGVPIGLILGYVAHLQTKGIWIG
ncbi:hypothetical protein GH714_021703 [Hevea brasiliensis]|uniref:Uncharacterized protein n=1 Tax=Hevea brasiliensis TaxID=3981 RepID=A0A6A6LZG2_HEVBR|nr:hypothetical protein GH714_021703 [Hevea brasiliensis]